MQKDFDSRHAKGEGSRIAEHVPPESVQDVIDRIKPLRRTVRELDIPIIYTKTVYDDDIYLGSIRHLRGKGILRTGTPRSEIVEELKPEEGDFVVEKQRPSAFYNTNLEILLRGLHVRDLVLGGIISNVCVESTARAAKFRDFNVILLADCSCTYSDWAHEASLVNIHNHFGVVSTSKEIYIKPYP